MRKLSINNKELRTVSGNRVDCGVLKTALMLFAQCVWKARELKLLFQKVPFTFGIMRAFHELKGDKWKHWAAVLCVPACLVDHKWIFLAASLLNVKLLKYLENKISVLQYRNDNNHHHYWVMSSNWEGMGPGVGFSRLGSSEGRTTTGDVFKLTSVVWAQYSSRL